MSEKQTLSRRRLLAVSAAGTIGGILVAAGSWPLWNYLAFRQAGPAGETIAIPRSEVEAGGVHFFDFRGRPAVVLQTSPGEFTALSMICTHLGCIVKWQPLELSGPPPAPLTGYPVIVEQDQLIIG